MYLQKTWLNPCSLVTLALEQDIDQAVVNAQGVAIVDQFNTLPRKELSQHLTVRYSLFFPMEPLVYFVV